MGPVSYVLSILQAFPQGSRAQGRVSQSPDEGSPPDRLLPAIQPRSHCHRDRQKVWITHAEVSELGHVNRDLILILTKWFGNEVRCQSLYASKSKFKYTWSSREHPERPWSSRHTVQCGHQCTNNFNEDWHHISENDFVKIVNCWRCPIFKWVAVTWLKDRALVY